MTGGNWNQSSEAIAAELARAFPGYQVLVRRDRIWDRPRYQLTSRDGSNPVCLISPDPDEIRGKLNGA
jgi:hypothetical protein